MNTFVVGSHQKCSLQGASDDIHNIFFFGEIRKILCGYHLLSGAINNYLEKGRIRRNVFSVSRLLVDDESVLQNL